MTSLNVVPKQRLTAKETSIANCEVLDEKHCIAVQGFFCRHYYKLVTLVLRKQPCCLPSLVVKNKPGKLVTSLHRLFPVC